MSEVAKEILSISLEEEMQQSYLDYAMSVIVGRALPDVRDGLKPVHRRVLYAMRVLGNDYNKAYKKSARVVGDVIGKYHPHGDTAVYDTIVRMAQPFSMRHMLVDGQGNFGSVDGDSPAAMRYTEVRMAKIAHEILADLDKETVDFLENYDGSESEPSVMPTKIPNLLINGSSGIAVGMATNIPPHNLTEIITACLSLIDNPEIEIKELMEHVPGPDFPTAGMINGTQGIYEAYCTGRGRVHIRARTEIEELGKRNREAIIVTELPYQVNKARLIEKIAELVRDKKIEGITELRDESDKDGMRIVIELRQGEVTDVVLNNLYKQTSMQTVFGINMVALHEGQPKLLNLKQILEAFIAHRREVVTRRTIFELKKARGRAHILEGQAVALANIDEVIKLIKASPTPAEAKISLLNKAWKPGSVDKMLQKAGGMNTAPIDQEKQYGLNDKVYTLSPIQAQAILDLRLHRLTGLEQDKILEEYKNILELIKGLLEILSDTDVLLKVIRDELNEIVLEYGESRRTEINQDYTNLMDEDLIPDEEVIVTLSHSGYIKAQSSDVYQAQKRGGRGRSATKMKDEDFIDKLFVANTHDTLLCFSSKGKIYWIKVYRVPLASRGARGKPIINLLPLEEGERISAVLPIREFTEDAFVFMATSNGTVKKTPLKMFSRPRSNGIIAISLKDDDLIDVAITDGNNEVLLVANNGKAIKFDEADVRPTGRTASGVRGIRLKSDYRVIALCIVNDGLLLTATENGYGKRTKIEEFSTQKRGGQGVIAIKTSDRNGLTVGALQVSEDDEIMLISSNGTLVRTPVEGISVVGRNTQGVTLIRLVDDQKLVGLAGIEAIEGDEDDDHD
jgi:DNA gyrase subunit A|tara:strand:- start:16411 stop:18960 length:2550 start_codon:yes stop_codon:yes gene_type:complete